MTWIATTNLQDIVYKASPFPTNAKGEKCFVCGNEFKTNGTLRNLIWNYSSRSEFGLQGSQNQKYTAVPIHIHKKNEITQSLCAKAGVDSLLYLGGRALLNEADKLLNDGVIDNRRHTEICSMYLSKTRPL